MLQRYKLRLGDGTVLGVDHEGLRTWAVDGAAMVQAATSRRWYPLKAFLAAERAAARRAARQRPSGREARPTGGPLPLVYPKPRASEATPPTEAIPESAALPDEVALIAEASGIEGLAEPLASPSERHPEPILEREVAPFDAPAAEAFVVSTTETLVVSAEALPFEPVQEWVAVPALVEEPPSELLLEEDLAAVVVADLEQVWIFDDDLTALPPLDDEAAHAVALSSADDTVEPLVVGPPPSLEASWEESTVPRWEAESEARLPPAHLSTAPPTPPPTPPPSLQVLADDLATARPGPAAEARRPADDVPIIPLKPLDDATPAATGRGIYEESPRETKGPPSRSELDEALVRWFVRGISAYDALLTGWIDRLARRPEQISSGDPTAASADWVGRPIEAERPLHEAPRQAERSSREPLKAPLPVRDLPILPFATVEEPEAEGDVYEAEGRLSAGWRSTKRIIVASGLLAGGLFAALAWETWLPRAEQLGQAAFSEVDRIRQDREHAERQRQALQEATERLPHLAPHTIRLLMVNDPTGVLDPPEMFRIASDAADRGGGALLPQEARELEELRRELLATLRPSERDRVRAYDAARARRLVFPFEGQDVVELVARGAYALTPESRARLQELFAKAIAAGLPVSPVAPGPPAKP